jgi:hypothetical protein
MLFETIASVVDNITQAHEGVLVNFLKYFGNILRERVQNYMVYSGYWRELLEELFVCFLVLQNELEIWESRFLDALIFIIDQR